MIFLRDGPSFCFDFCFVFPIFLAWKQPISHCFQGQGEGPLREAGARSGGGTWGTVLPLRCLSFRRQLRVTSSRKPSSVMPSRHLKSLPRVCSHRTELLSLGRDTDPHPPATLLAPPTPVKPELLVGKSRMSLRSAPRCWGGPSPVRRLVHICPVNQCAGYRQALDSVVPAPSSRVSQTSPELYNSGETPGPPSCG